MKVKPWYVPLSIVYLHKNMLNPCSAISADPEPPEARAGSLGEGRDEGGPPSLLSPDAETLRPPVFGVFDANLEPPEACARSLGEGREEGGAPSPSANSR